MYFEVQGMGMNTWIVLVRCKWLMAGTVLLTAQAISQPLVAQTNIPFCSAEVESWAYSIANRQLFIQARIKIEGEEDLPREIYVEFSGQGWQTGPFPIPVSISANSMTRAKRRASTVDVLLGDWQQMDKVISLDVAEVNCYAGQ